MSALKSQSSLLRYGFGQAKDTVLGLVDPNLPIDAESGSDTDAVGSQCDVDSQPDCSSDE